jgi:lysozyme
MRTLGCDISSWSGKTDFGKMKSAGMEFCWAKSCQIQKDAQFSNYWPAMKQAGLLRGAFAYLDWRSSELTQAKLFCDTIGGDIGELPPMLDLEMDPAPFKLSPALVQGKVWNWLQAVEKATGRVPIIYAGASFWTQWMTPDKGWLKYPFWLAWYASEPYINFISLLKGYSHGAPKPWKDWTIWQYTGNGNGPQYGTQALSLDMDWFNGDLAALQAWANAPAPVPGPVTPPVISAPAPLYPAYKVVAGQNPNVHVSPDGTSKVLGYILSGSAVSIDTITGNYGHFQPNAQYQSGGWVYMPYLIKQG